jgi:hypothetical protein
MMSKGKQEKKIILLRIVADRLLALVVSGFELVTKRPGDDGQATVSVDKAAFENLRTQLRILIPNKMAG